MTDIPALVNELKSGNRRALARALSLVENSSSGHEDILLSIADRKIPVVGITGPPGAGKSTLVNACISRLLEEGKKIGVIAVDPTSPFHKGSLLGDRVRMSSHFLNDNVFIRSLATRGSLGGLSSKAVDMLEVMKSSDLDIILVETVGVGQSEVEIATLADVTLLVLVPEGGDDVQAIKSGIMEIADVYVVNKSDRPGADLFVRNLSEAIHSYTHNIAPVIKAVASKAEGIDEVIKEIHQCYNNRKHDNDRQAMLYAEKVINIIRGRVMQRYSVQVIRDEIKSILAKGSFNMYKYAFEKSDL